MTTASKLAIVILEEQPFMRSAFAREIEEHASLELKDVSGSLDSANIAVAAQAATGGVLLVGCRSLTTALAAELEPASLAGIFSSEKGKQAVYAGLESARSSMEMVGPVVAKDTDADGDIDEIVFIVANTSGGEAINFTQTTDSNDDGLLSNETALHTTQINYIDKVKEVTDITWTQTAVGKNDSDNLLEANEKFEITITVAHLATVITGDDTFIIEIAPDGAATVVIERTTPPTIDKVNNMD
jgi:archaellin